MVNSSVKIQFTKLSRRERQIMDILYTRGESTVLEIQGLLPKAPSDMAIRRMMQILLEKGQVKRFKKGREFIYQPKQSRAQAGILALKHLLNTYFNGGMGMALETYLTSGKFPVQEEEIKVLKRLVSQTSKV